MKSYIVEAIGGGGPRCPPPTVAQASQFLRDMNGPTTMSGIEGVYSLRKTEQPGAVTFQLYDKSVGGGVLLHFNKMKR